MKISKKQERYFELAKRISYQSNYISYRHGAILIKGGSIINISSNKSNSCAFGNRFRVPYTGSATLHAEIGAILGVERTTTQNADIYVVRINKKDEFRMSKPCSMCQNALKFCGISRVFYSTDNGNIFKMMKF